MHSQGFLSHYIDIPIYNSHVCNVYLVANAYFQKQKKIATKEQFFLSETEVERTWRACLQAYLSYWTFFLPKG